MAVQIYPSDGSDTVRRDRGAMGPAPAPAPKPPDWETYLQENRVSPSDWYMPTQNPAAPTSVEDLRNWNRYRQAQTTRMGEAAAAGQDPFSVLSAEQLAQAPSYFGVTAPTTAAMPPGGQLAALLQQLGLGGKGTGQSAADKKAAAERAALNEWYRSGGHLKQYEALRGALQGQIGASRQAAQGQYDTALRNILGGYTGAEQMIGTGYNAVADYLRQNMPNAYAGFQAAPVAPEQASQGYFGAYGVDMAPVMAQIAADRSAAQAGGGMFTNLVDVLNRSSQQAAASRQAELELARNLGMQTLGQQRAAMESNAAASLQQALAQIAASEQDKLYEIAVAEAKAKEEADKSLAGAPKPRSTTGTSSKGGKK